VSKFWDLFATSTILSGFIVVLCIGALCYLAIVGKPIPEVLVNICLIVVSFFFGTKASTSEAQIRALRKGE
jgi:hypothetical protein